MPKLATDNFARGYLHVTNAMFFVPSVVFGDFEGGTKNFLNFLLITLSRIEVFLWINHMTSIKMGGVKVYERRCAKLNVDTN